MKAILKTGSVARYETIQSGLVPCKVLSIKREDMILSYSTIVRFAVTVRVTADRYAYKRGEILSGLPSGHVAPKESVFVRNGMYWIRAYDVQAD